MTEQNRTVADALGEAVEIMAAHVDEWVETGKKKVVGSILKEMFSTPEKKATPKESPHNDGANEHEQLKELLEIVQEVANSAVVTIDPRIRYVEIQLDRQLWMALKPYRTASETE